MARQLKTSVILLCLILYAMRLEAQLFIPSTTPDKLLTGKNNLSSLSCDMLSTPLISPTGSYFGAIAHCSDKGRISLFHSSGIFDTTSIANTGWGELDVALADDADSLGYRFYAISVYTLNVSGTVQVCARKQRFRLTSGSAISVTASSTNLPLSTNGGSTPSVDVLPNPGQMVDLVTPSMQKYIITWDAGDDSLHTTFGAASSALTTTTIVKHAFHLGRAGKVIKPQISAMRDVALNKSIGNIAYIFYDSLTADTGLYVAVVDFSGSSFPSLISTTKLDSGSHLWGPNGFTPRIESMTTYDPTKTAAKWQVTCGSKIYTYNSLVPAGYVCTTLSGDTSYSKGAPVAAGAGLPFDTTSIGNRYYTVGWKKAGSDFLTQNIKTSTGQFESKSMYFIVNDTNTVTQYLDLTSADNTGKGLLATWYDGTRIWYKITDALPAAPVPYWPATAASYTDMPVWISGTAGRIDWVNTDRYNLYLKNDNTVKGYIQAVANDFYDSTLGTYKVVINVFSSITNTVRTLTIDTARHPDIVICDDLPDSLAIVDTPNYQIVVVYEDLRTSSTQIYGRAYQISNPYDDAVFALSPVSTRPVPVGNTSDPKACPHIDAAPGENPSIFPAPSIYSLTYTWAENDGSSWKVKTKYANLSDNLTTRPEYYVGQGENPDVARSVSGFGHYSYHTYYDAVNDKLICKKIDASGISGTVIDTFVLDTAVIVTGPPRIEAFNKRPDADDNEWVVVAEVQNGGYSEIRAYRGDANGMHKTNYSTIPVKNTSTLTTTDANNPLYNNNGYSPCVAAGNGPDTYTDPTAMGNNNYTLGWWIDGAQYNALTFEHNSPDPANDGYAQVNKSNVRSSVISGGQCKLALANGNNDGAGIAAAWVADTTGGPMVMIKQRPALSFKPSVVNDNAAPEQQLMLYPNPTSGRLFISTTAALPFTISNLAGEIFVRGINSAAGIDVHTLPAGLYFIRIQGKAGTVSYGRFTKL